MTHNNPAKSPPYDGLHATVVDALRYEISGEALAHAAHEVLQRLRNTGLDIPANPSA
jgi:hypothetical protein